MKTICGLDCCGECPLLGKGCEGCEATNGHPCGGECIAANTITKGGPAAYDALKAALIAEINALGVEGLHVDDLNLLFGAYVNQAYTLPNGQQVKFLRDEKVYFGNQVERPDVQRCYGVAADEESLLVSDYGPGGADAKLVLYKNR